MTQTIPRQIRVFISSTFRDMQAERDHLVKFIFPQLRKLCESRAVTWGEVDLRWGITDEQSAEGQVLPICLAEIERSRPYFIGLLGERYGWIPDTIDPELIEREPWLAQHLDQSVTELEILHGVLNDPQMTHHALFYFRDPDYIHSIENSQRDDFVEVPWRSDIETYGMAEAQKRVAQRQAKLLRLKNRIRQSGLPVKENYRDPQQLGEWVLADLTRIINQLFPEDARPDALSRETALHEAFAQSRARLYIGADHYFAKLNHHALVPTHFIGASPNSTSLSNLRLQLMSALKQHFDLPGDLSKSAQQLRQAFLPLVLLGESGSGKSALLANWSLKYQADHPDAFVLTHFIGASPQSTDLSSLLLRLMSALKQRFDLPGDLPQSAQQLRQALPNWLAMAGAKGKLVLVLDGLDQLDNRDSAQELDWLPLELPEQAAIFLSTLPCRVLEVIRERNWPTLSVLPLSLDERAQIARQYLALFSKQLGPARLQRIIEDPQSQNPLALRLLLDELRQFGKHEQLDAIIDRFLAADSIPEMLQLQLERLEQDFEKDHPGLVRQALSLLWAARFGLSEAELLDLLGKPGQPLPGRFWSPLSLALESSLVDRGGLLSFFHNYLRQAVEARYLNDEESKNRAHFKLADYFESLEGTPNRKLDELPWQLSQGKQWQRLHDLLADLNYFEASFTHSKIDLMTFWAEVEANSPLTRVQAYQPILGSIESTTLHMLSWLSLMFMDSGFLPEAMKLHKVQEWIFRQLDNPQGLQASLNNQALILKTWGRLEEAMQLHKEVERICRQLGNPDGLQASLGNQAAILYTLGRLQEAMNLLKEQELLCRQLVDLDSMSASLNAQAMILKNWGRLKEAMKLLKETERVCRQQGNLDSLQGYVCNQALILQDWGRLEEAMKLHKETERICRQLGNLDGLARSLGNQGLILATWGKLEEAMRIHKKQEHIYQKLGNLDGLKTSLNAQAGILNRWGRLEEAMNLYKEQERICHQLDNPEGLQVSLGNQALILKIWGRLEEAMELHKEEERICRQLGNLVGLARSFGNQALILRDWGKLDEAMELHKEEERICRQLGNPDGLQTSLGNQAVILCDWSKLEEAMVLLKEKEHICRQLGNLDGLSVSLNNQANILSDWYKLEEAMIVYKEAECIFRQLENLDGLAGSLGNQANILHAWGRHEEAMNLLKEKRSILQKLGNMDDLEKTLNNLAFIQKSLGRYKEALDFMVEQEHICRQSGNLESLSANLVNQANILYSWGKINEALVLMKEQENLCRQLSDMDGLQSSLNNQAHILRTLGREEEALELYKEQELICRKMGNLEHLLNSLNNQAAILKNRRKLNEAIDLYKEVERICRKSNNMRALCAALANQGLMKAAQGDKTEAKRFLMKPMP